jgi:dienelactone hydrolase
MLAGTHPRRFGLLFGTLWIAGCSKGSETPAGPDIQTREVTYQQDGTPLKGFMAWDASRQGKRPGVLVVHEWWGLNDHSRNAARRLAEAGYVGFALDMYGDGKNTTHPDTAQQFMSQASSNLPAMVARFNAARTELLKAPNVDSTRVGAIGYCFGGAVVLAQARAGADLDAVVSFHGALIPGKVDSGVVKARVLVLTGADDPMVPNTLVETFRQEMAAAGAANQTQIVVYPDARHSFTNPHADSVGMAGLGYNAAADLESWQAMLKLFREVWPE